MGESVFDKISAAYYELTAAEKKTADYIMNNRGRSQYLSYEFAWIGDFNPVMNRMIERYVCASKHKMHTTYRFLFDRTREFERCPRLGLKRTTKEQ